jgi:aryl-alcohol dehydrogenase-like predicted oxidoreductase
MRTGKLGWTGLKLTTIGLGTFAMGGSGWQFSWGPQDDSESISTILRALEKGVNWIDTAPGYGCGHVEEIIGKAIKGLSSKPIIATKCGLHCDKDRNIIFRLKRESVRTEVEASLRRLQIDVIDLYQIHWPIPEEDIEEAWDAIAEAVKEGKVRYAGVSNFNIEQIKRIHSIHPVASLQPPYNILERGIEDKILDYCRQNNIGVIVYGPMAHGLLSGKFSRERLQNLHQEDNFRRQASLYFQEPQFSANLELAEGLRPIAQKHGRTVAQLAIAWTLRRPEVTSAIVGARRPSQIEETILAGDWVLSGEDISAIDKLIAKREKALKQV